MRKNILIAFILNLAFSIFEFLGGIFTGSVAILSDSLHDLGDSLSIGIAFFLEKKSRKSPDDTHTYGYLRYSVLGSVITTVILLAGSILVIVGSVGRIFNPTHINYNGMIVFALVGTITNLIAAFVTHGSDSLNEKAVNLHMLEDVLGWIVVLIGAVVMRFTDISLFDPFLSIGVSIFILINAIKNLNEVLDIFLQKTPKNMDIAKIKNELLEIEGVLDVHHIHLSSIDGAQNIATMHIVCSSDFAEIKHIVKHKLEHFGIAHTTLEFETEDEHCHDTVCSPKFESNSHHHHNHH